MTRFCHVFFLFIIIWCYLGCVNFRTQFGYVFFFLLQSLPKEICQHFTISKKLFFFWFCVTLLLIKSIQPFPVPQKRKKKLNPVELIHLLKSKFYFYIICNRAIEMQSVITYLIQTKKKKQQRRKNCCRVTKAEHSEVRLDLKL